MEGRKCLGGECKYGFTCWLSGGHVAGSCDDDSIISMCCLYLTPVEGKTFSNQNAASFSSLTKVRQSFAEARKINNWLSSDFSLTEDSKVQANSNEIKQMLDSHQDIAFGPVINDPVCGRPRISNRRIVGGAEAGFGRFPWQAMIRIGKARCGGALINSRNVVTAGHCVHNAQAREIRVYLGEYELMKESEPLPRQEFRVRESFIHPYYEFTPQADRYDVAVLRLDKPVRYAPHIIPACLPTKNYEISEGVQAYVSGWGATKVNDPYRPLELQAVDVKVVESRRCEEWHARNKIEVKIYDDMMCAGHEAGEKDACQGDSGGPLMMQAVKNNKTNVKNGTEMVEKVEKKFSRWTLIGLVSAGYSCAKPGQPGIYHRLSKTADWISYVARHL